MNLLKQLIVSDKDAEKFLQGQLTCDVTTLTKNSTQYGAACNIKGRVIATFKISHLKDHFQLILPAETAPILKEHLQKYIIFSKASVEIKDIDHSYPHWQKEDIQNGFPNIYAKTTDTFTPHMLNLPKLEAASFNKGCYLGQEIIARTEHLGKVKRHLHFATMENTQLPKPGDIIKNNTQQTIGIIIDAISDKDKILFLAVIQDEHAEEFALQHPA